MPILVVSTAANGFSASSTQRTQDGTKKEAGGGCALASFRSCACSPVLTPFPSMHRLIYDLATLTPQERPQSAHLSWSVWGARLKGMTVVTRTVSLLSVCGTARARFSSGR